MFQKMIFIMILLAVLSFASCNDSNSDNTVCRIAGCSDGLNIYFSEKINDPYTLNIKLNDANEFTYSCKTRKL